MYLNTKLGRRVVVPDAAENDSINAGIQADRATRELSADEFKKLKPLRGRPLGSGTKTQVSLRIDTEVLAYFKAQGAGWQTKINDTLKATLKKPIKPA